MPKRRELMSMSEKNTKKYKSTLINPLYRSPTKATLNMILTSSKHFSNIPSILIYV